MKEIKWRHKEQHLSIVVEYSGFRDMIHFQYELYPRHTTVIFMLGYNETAKYGKIAVESFLKHSRWRNMNDSKLP